MKNRFFQKFLLVFAFGLAGGSFAHAQGECSSLDLGIAPSFDAGPNVSASVMADFNQDSKIDAAVVNFERRTVSVLNGDGFGGFAPARTYPTTANVYRLTSADLNNDNKLDLVAAGGQQNEIVILLNDGLGGFQSPVLFVPPNSGDYYDLESGDFNGDGNQDIAAIRTQTNRQLHIFLGNGQGTLTFASSMTLGGSEALMKAGNLNDDIYTDIVVSGGGSSSSRFVSYMFGAQSGSFSLTFGFNVLERATGFSIARFNMDSFPDFVAAFEDTTTPTQPYLRPYFGSSGGGAFTPGANIEPPYFLSPTDVTTGDFNGDGHQDIAAPLSGHAVMVIYGRGDGQFQDAGHWAVQNGAGSIFSNDLNTDGKPDLVTIQQLFTLSNSLSVLTNLGGQKFHAPKAVLWGLSQISAADFNGDGLLDFASSRKSSFVSVSSVEVNLNSADGLGPDMGIPTPKALTQMTVGDFNGDGHKDVVTSHSDNDRVIAVYLGNGTGTLSAPVLTSLGVAFENVIAGRFNGDTSDDVFVVDRNGQGYSMLSNGNGTFTTAPNFPVMLQGSVVKLLKGDFNEDGHLDLIVSSGVVHLWLGNGAGQFTRSMNPIPSVGDVVAGDFNEDGHLDLAGFDVSFSIKGILGLGNGQFGDVFSMTHQNTGERRSLVAADLNGDGASDLAFLINLSDTRNLFIVQSNGAAIPSWQSPVTYSVGGLSGYTSALFAADYNADGKVDLGYNAEASRGIIYNTSGQTPCISIADASVTEGDTGQALASFTVTLSQTSAQAVRVNYSLTANTATLGTDFQNVSGRLDIPAGQTTGTIQVPIIGDVTDEFDEQFFVNLSSPANASITRATAAGTIIDNDAEPTITVSDVAIGEGLQANFNVTLSAPSGKPISFRYTTANVTATAGSDYVAGNNTLNLTPGATSVGFGIFTTPDSMYELNETFVANLSEPVNVSFADAQGVGTINNNDPIPTLSLFQAIVPEGDSGTSTPVVHVRLSNPTYLPVTFNVLTSDGTAIGNQDYVPADTIVTVPPEIQDFTTTVQIKGDVVKEPTETFFLNIYNIANATATQVQSSVMILDDDSTMFDLDGDGKSDIGIFRPSTGDWWYQRSLDSITRVFRFGLSSDNMVPADYTGDGRTDIAMWRRSTGQWFVLRSENNTFYALPFGTDGDVPAPSDYDNDGRADITVFRPSNATWYISQSTGGTRIEQFGSNEDLPVPADYDGDGRSDIAIYRPSLGQWWLNRSTAGVIATTFGNSVDKPVPGEYTGDGKSDIAFWRPSTGEWFVLRSEDFSYYSVPFGAAEDLPVPADYDGDGRWDTAVFRPSTGTWYSQRSTAGTVIQVFGADGDRPVQNAFIR